MLNRGGRFEDRARKYKGDRVGHPYGASLNIYQEKAAFTIHSGTGKKNPGVAMYVPIRDYLGREPDELRKGHELALIAHRTISQCKSRTIAGTPLAPADNDREWYPG